MAIDVNKLKAWPFKDIEQRYSERDTILYALGVGIGHDPMDTDALRYVYEDGLQALPTMAVVLGYPGFWAKDPATGIDWVKVLHGEQSLELHAPLPAAGTVIGKSRVTALVDKGAGKGALMYSERDIVDAASGTVLAVSRSVSFLRGDGGFAAAGQKSDDAPPPRAATPDTPPDHVCELTTRPESALIYRLTRRLQPGACRPGGGPVGRLRAADPARPLQLRRQRPRAAEDAVRLERGAAEGDRLPLFRHPSIRAKRCAWRCGIAAMRCSSAPGRWSAMWWC